MSRLIDLIASEDDAVRNRSLDSVCTSCDQEELLRECRSLDDFWRRSDNLYHRVRAQLFLSAIYRFHLPALLPATDAGRVPPAAHHHLWQRRFTEAIDVLLEQQAEFGPSDALASALAEAYRDLAFQTLADQVRRSVREVVGNRWMFRTGHPADHPLRIRRELVPREGEAAPILRETTAVRMDFSHSGWSDIFFLGMDFPEGARVINASVDLGVHGRDAAPRPPIECYLRVLDRPTLRLVSVDLESQTEVASIPEVFDFARDYLGLVKAALIAAGLVPPGMEGCELPIADLLEQIVGPNRGLEIVSKVNDIPKGSRLAVSTNLLGSLISLCMRATGQVSALTGALDEADRRIVAARAILGEWIGGSGGGWQDSGGIWPGIKLIAGEHAAEGDPEFGVSRGRLLPRHRILTDDEVSPQTRQKLQESLVLVHGGMAQNVGPILEMVTEKYLLRSEREWEARQEAIALLDEIQAALAAGDIRRVGAATTRNFEQPLQSIIPWCNNLFTQTMIDRSRAAFGDDFWGFWMLGGMSGGGMGFLFAPERQAEAKAWMQQALRETKQQFENSLPFAMEPVVYDFQINDSGTTADLVAGDAARMPNTYYSLMLPGWLRTEPRERTPQVSRELDLLSRDTRSGALTTSEQEALLMRLLPAAPDRSRQSQSLGELLERYGFDREQHEFIRGEMRAGRIGLAQNRLPPQTQITDVRDSDLIETRAGDHEQFAEIGCTALQQGEAAVVSLAAGAGSRWTSGAGVSKALHPFCRLDGRYRRFIDVHLAKTRRTARTMESAVPHVFTTGYLTDDSIRDYLNSLPDDVGIPVHVSTGQSVGLRMIPMVRDLAFQWQEMPQQQLDEQQEKVRESLRNALVGWARRAGEGEDYTDNLPLQCLHPVGHWYEIPNMLRNGTLAALLKDQPQVKYLLVHNIDTLGANLNPDLLGRHIAAGHTLSYEVIPRRIDDRGGGLARVDGRTRLVEGLALPREEDEFQLRFYNTLTNWISIDPLLEFFGLTRAQLSDRAATSQAVRRLSQRLPTYVTIKDAKKRWGQGQEDVYPVAQFEKLWGDMSALAELRTGYFVVQRFRGLQLKQPSQLDAWLRDGSAAYVEALCEWE